MLLLSIRNVSKTFAGHRVLAGVHLEVDAGEVHALVGHNGSGKSTLIKILAGYHRPDPGGAVAMHGQDLSGHPRATAPLRFIHQDLGLVPTLGASENLALGRGFVRGRLGRISWARQHEVARQAVARLGAEIDVCVPVKLLGPAERSIVAIARAMVDMPPGGVLVLDEPTAALPTKEVERLFDAVRTVAAAGSGVLFVSHRLDEVLQLADRVTVLRDGRVVACDPTDTLDHDRLVELITGSATAAFRRSATARAHNDLVLQVEGLRGHRLRGVSFGLHRGEILGVAGLTGAGREELPNVLAGAQAPTSGVVRIDGRPLPMTTPRAALAHGVVLVPADRDTRGLIGSHTVRENVVLPRLHATTCWSPIDRRAEREDVADWIGRVAIAPAEPELPVGRLSGGNRQKALLARALRLEPRVLVLDEPTQGVDVGSKAMIYQLVTDAAMRGAAVVVCSSESEELAQLCDRVLVLRGGSVVAELEGASLTEEAVTAATVQPEPVPERERRTPCR